tara:strand:+ start:2567 stop:2932 length:366 start_codon:yes stop_codon:yes gene_type:complete
MYISSHKYLSAPRSIHADSLGSLIAQLSLADLAMIFEKRIEDMMVFIGQLDGISATCDVSSVDINGDHLQINLDMTGYEDIMHSPVFEDWVAAHMSEEKTTLKSAEIVHLVTNKDTPSVEE